MNARQSSIAPCRLPDPHTTRRCSSSPSPTGAGRAPRGPSSRERRGIAARLAWQCESPGRAPASSGRNRPCMATRGSPARSPAQSSVRAARRRKTQSPPDTGAHRYHAEPRRRARAALLRSNARRRARRASRRVRRERRDEAVDRRRPGASRTSNGDDPGPPAKAASPQRTQTESSTRGRKEERGAWTASPAFDRNERAALGHGSRYPATTRISVPPPGRSVIPGSGTIFCPGTQSSRTRRDIVARSSVPSTIANVEPIHSRAPPPNGK